MSYRLINANALNGVISYEDYEKVLNMPCVYADLPNGLDGNHYILQEPNTGHCKDCKWWRDSDGLYRRGSHAESQCPINRREVFEGNGYCYMFEPHESEE